MPDAHDADRLRELYRPLLVTDPGDEPAEEYVSEQVDLSDLRGRLSRHFHDHSALLAVRLVIDGVPVGVVDRRRIKDPGTAGPPAGDVGAGERASHPVASSRYRPVRFRCRPGCSEVVVRTYYDDRVVPRCDKGHGAMRLDRERPVDREETRW